MSCNGCFGGCAEIISDQCVKYTGENIGFLGISTGDTLAMVEAAIASYLLTLSDGSGIIPIITATDCALISDALPAEGDITLNNVIDALITAACSLQIQVTALSDDLAAIEEFYTLGCITSAQGTHNVLQAVITQLCLSVADITALEAAITGFTTPSDVNELIATYLSVNGSESKMYNKMVPYVAMPYFGPLVNYPSPGDAFVAGIGIGSWEKVYLCNGTNGTPDLRGLTTIGATSDMGGGAYDPVLTGGATYIKGLAYGAKTVILGPTQIPSHTHTISSVGDHAHIVTANNTDSDQSGALTGGVYNSANDGSTATSPAGAHTHVLGNTGGGLSHENVSPSRACYYIIFIP